MIIVVKGFTNNNNQYMFKTDSASGCFIQTNQTPNKWGYYQSGLISYTSSDPILGRTYTFVIKQEGTTISLYENGSLLLSETVSNIAITSLFTLGTFDALEMFGNIRGFYMFDAALNDTDRGSMDTYISDKWSTNAQEGVLLGDSIMAHNSNAMSPAEVADFTNSTNLAVGGNTIVQQHTAWNGYGSKGTTEWVAILVGYNNCRNINESAATAITAYQALVDQVRTDVGASVPIVLVKMTPAKQGLINELGATDGATAFAKFEALNEAIEGNGATPITDVDGVVTEHYALMDDGTDNMKDIFDSGDDVHPSNNGRSVWATCMKRVLAPLVS